MGNFRGRAFSTIFSSEPGDDVFNEKALPGAGSGKQDNLTLLTDDENSKVDTLLCEKNELEKNLEVVKSECENLKNAKLEWEEKEKNFEQEIDAKTTLIQDLENSIRIKENSISELEHKIGEIEILLNDSSDKLKNQINATEKMETELMKEIELLTTENNNLKAELDDFENKQPVVDDGTMEEIEIDVDQISSVQNELIVAENKILLLEADLATARNEYAALEKFLNKIGLDGGAGELKKAQKTIQQLTYIIEKQKIFINEREEYISKIKIGIRETTEQLLNENTPQFLEVTTENLPILEDFITIKEQEKIMSKIINHMQFMEENFIRKLEEEKAIKTQLESEKINLLEKVEQIVSKFESGEQNILNIGPIAPVNVNDISDQSRGRSFKKLFASDDHENKKKNQDKEVDEESVIVNITEIDENKEIFTEEMMKNSIYDRIASEELDDYRGAYNKEFTLEEVREIVKTTIEGIPVKKMKGESLNPEERRLNGKFKEFKELLAVTA